MCRRLSNELHTPWFLLYWDATWCSYRHGASPENYFTLRFFSLPERQRRSFLTSGRSKKLDKELNRNAKPEELRLLSLKQLSDRFFQNWVRRDFLYLPDCTDFQLSDFLQKHPVFISKPVSASMGKGFRLLQAKQIGSVKEFADTGRRQRLLLEEPIAQCPELSRLHPDSVNTVRINAARNRQGEVVLIGACLKCGQNGHNTDNFHSGGIAWPLDLSTGRVCGPGRDNHSLRNYERHPDTGFMLVGFQVSYWYEILRCVNDIMNQVPSIRYAGWDIALTLQGPEVVEGNVRWPGGNIIQFDNIGKYPLLRKCIR